VPAPVIKKPVVPRRVIISCNVGYPIFIEGSSTAGGWWACSIDGSRRAVIGRAIETEVF